MNDKPFILETIVRENIKKLKPYISARDEFKEFERDMVFLDANENPFKTLWNRYPDPQQNKLKSQLAKIKNLNNNQILLGNGSDEVLDLIFRVFCDPNKDSALVLPPTYGMYEVLAETNAVEVIKVPLSKEFQPQVENILGAVKPNTKLLLLCSPNNPTANSFDFDLVEKLIKQFQGIVVIDEAYIDFSEEESWCSKLSNYRNIIVTQTLSKAYGLAGIRLGMCFASPNIVALLNLIKPPYNINSLTQSKALEALTESSNVKEQVAVLIRERETLSKGLIELDFIQKVYPSQANFLLVKVDDALARYKQLVDSGIVVRNRSREVGCENCLRITVGTPEENEMLLKTLKTLP